VARGGWRAGAGGRPPGRAGPGERGGAARRRGPDEARAEQAPRQDARSHRTAHPGFEDLFCDAVPLPVPARATAAARAFATGNGYLTGLIVDRLA
jgi:hypothetical protein